MISRLIRLVIVVALIALVVNIFPTAYDWLKTAIEWVLSFGKWGVITLASCVIIAVLGFLD